MKGTVVGTWFNSIAKIYGQNVLEDALNEYGWPISRIITPLEDIADEDPFKIVEIVAKRVGKIRPKSGEPSDKAMLSHFTKLTLHILSGITCAISY